MTMHKFRVKIVCDDDPKILDLDAVDFRQAAEDALEHENAWIRSQGDMHPVIKVINLESDEARVFNAYPTFHLE